MDYKRIQLFKNILSVTYILFIFLYSEIIRSPQVMYMMFPQVMFLYSVLSFWHNMEIIKAYNYIRDNGDEYIGLLTGGKTPLFLNGGLNIFFKYKPHINVPVLSVNDEHRMYDMLGIMDSPPDIFIPDDGNKAGKNEIIVLYHERYPKTLILRDKRTSYLMFIYMWTCIYALFSIISLIIIVV